MRVVSPKELNQLNAQSEIPFDLRLNYLPVEFRVASRLDGELLIKSTYGMSSDERNAQYRKLASRVADDLGTSQLFKTLVDQKGSVFNRAISSDFEWSSFSFANGRRGNHVYNELNLLPIDRLLFKKDLKEFSIQDRPGYLYLGWQYSTEKYEVYNTESITKNIRSMKDWVYYAESLIERGQRINYKNKKDLSPRKQALESIMNGEVIEFKDQKIEPWRGRLDDILLATNSRILATRGKSEEPLVIDYVLETPLEIPAGFVRETAHLLKRKWRAASKLVDRFVSLVFERNNPEDLTVNQSNIPLEKSPFPQGEQQLVGPDRAWHTCEDPDFVQTILMARLIGGNAWQYALGNLEMKMGERTVR